MRVKDLYKSFDGGYDIDLPQSLDTLTESEIDRLVEFKALTLVNKQKALRGDIVSDFFFFNTVAMNEGNQVHFTRMKRPTLLEVNITEQFDLQQRSERSGQKIKKSESILRAFASNLGLFIHISSSGTINGQSLVKGLYLCTVSLKRKSKNELNAQRNNVYKL